MQNQRPILCLDFDGVLHAYSRGWQDGTIYDGPVPGATEFLCQAVAVFDVSILSSRSHRPDSMRAMKHALLQWLTNDFGYERARAIFDVIDFPLHKPPAFVTLDDRALTFTGEFPAIDELRAFRTWTQRASGEDK